MAFHGDGGDDFDVPILFVECAQFLWCFFAMAVMILMFPYYP